MVLIVAAINLGVFLISHRLDRYRTNESTLIIEKLLGIFLAALAVQLMVNGPIDLRIITLSWRGSPKGVKSRIKTIIVTPYVALPRVLKRLLALAGPGKQSHGVCDFCLFLL